MISILQQLNEMLNEGKIKVDENGLLANPVSQWTVVVSCHVDIVILLCPGSF